MRGDAGFPVRFRFVEHGKVRFISHRDVARAFERAFRIRQLPLAFTQGFVPRPKVSFGLALSVGHESDAEYLDVELAEPIDLASISEDLSAVLPQGVEVTGSAVLADRAPALQESVTAVDYQVTVIAADGSRPDARELTRNVERALRRDSLAVPRIRKGRTTVEDIRPMIRTLSVEGSDDHGVLVHLELSTQPRGARPGEILVAIGDDLAESHVLRTHQWIERGGARLEPLEADARPRVPEARAS